MLFCFFQSHGFMHRSPKTCAWNLSTLLHFLFLHTEMIQQGNDKNCIVSKFAWKDEVVRNSFCETETKQGKAPFPSMSFYVCKLSAHFSSRLVHFPHPFLQKCPVCVQRSFFICLHQATLPYLRGVHFLSLLSSFFRQQRRTTLVFPPAKKRGEMGTNCCDTVFFFSFLANCAFWTGRGGGHFYDS